MLHRLQIKFGCNWTSTFQTNYTNFTFPPNLISDDRWPWYMTFDVINIQRSSYCIFHPSFKGDPNNENQHFPPYLISDDPRSWYITFDLINIWRNPYCIFDLRLVVIERQLFKGDPNNENLTKVEHTYTYITYRRNSLSRYPPIALQARG